jgi:hypothetical protein
MCMCVCVCVSECVRGRERETEIMERSLLFMDYSKRVIERESE